ncbi:hypothetical protein CW731_02275 [Polaribacter sp. ALD11]|uniref:DUF6452 family protein n=1 Tax=Polaribacter sp. ALD11 TaxID=2058137 RepID=UPI000C30A3E6|nr:DUF6452 family protein [Polaribacter sp. ALD11]AUC84195.1 hypothetical protein CW731_02275 [Polaribacter sp. ALD11]
MKKIILFLLLFLVLFSACEKDDFCVQNPVTSKLIIDFYDATNRETPKKVQLLSVWSGTKDTISQYTSVSENSISIPLNSLTSETVYSFKKNTSGGATSKNEITTFTIKYDTEEEFVSRSCGYKVVFNNVAFSADTGSTSWIKDFTPTTIINLDNQTTAHVQIFH